MNPDRDLTTPDRTKPSDDDQAAPVASIPAPPNDEFATLNSDSAPPRSEPSAAASHVRLASLGDVASAGTQTRYARTHLHARGGIGQVWLARDGELGREVALKELRPEQGGNSDAWARFVDEARITSQLEHPGIVPIYELAVRPEEGDPFYTMRLIRGKTLDRAIRDYHDKKRTGLAGPLDLAALLTAFVSLCNTVGYAHSRGVIHRDLKGQNVVLGDFGEVILLDWGIAKLVDPVDPARAGTATSAGFGHSEPARGETLQGQVFGTPFYMAPEQAEGRIDAIDARTDVYGLGAILYEILSGKAPYHGNTTVEVLRKVSEEPPVAPRLVNPGVARALEAICLKAMAKRSEHRYPSALALAEEVRRWLADEPISAYREPFATRAARFAKRHRAAVVATAALMLVAIVALGISSVLIGRERDEARRQRQQARQAVDDSYTRVAEEWLADRLDPLQREFLAKALAYYRDFTGPDAGDPALRLERGRAQLRMGDVLRKLGQHAEAEAAYDQSLAIFTRLAADDPTNATTRDYLAEATYRLGAERATRNQGADLAAAGRLFGDAAAMQNDLLSKTPTSARTVALGRTLNALADLHRVTGHADEAEATYGRAITMLKPAVAQDPRPIPPRQELGVALDGLAFLLKERGRVDEARATVQQAIEVDETLVADAPTLPTPRDALAKAYNTLALLLRDVGTAAESEAVLDKEVALNRRLATDYPQRPEYRRTLARALINLGIIYREAIRIREAEAAYAESLKLNETLAAEFPDVRKYARDQARCLNSLADLKVIRKTDPEPFYRRALKIQEALRAAAPGVAEHQIDEAGVRKNLGSWLAGNGRGPEGIDMINQAVTLFDKAAVADPNDPGVRRNLAVTLNSLAGAYLTDKQPAAAEDAYRRAVNAYDLLVSLPTALPADRLKLASCLSNQADNRTKAKLPGSADSLRRSLALLDAIAKEGPPTPDLRLRLAAAQNNLAEWLAAEKQPAEAEVAYREALNLLDGLVKEFPAMLTYRSVLGEARGNVGEFLVAQGRSDDARNLLEQGINEERTALAAGPEVRISLRKHLATLATLALQQKAHAQAASAGEEMLRLADSASSVQVEVAELMAQCVTLVTKDSQLAEPRRLIQAGAYADRAIALLRQAIEGGRPDASRLLRDSKFDSIRNRDGFKALEPEKVGSLGSAHDHILTARGRESRITTTS